MEEEISVYGCLTEFRKPLVNEIIRVSGIHDGSKGLGVGCGIGEITGILASGIIYEGQTTGILFISGISGSGMSKKTEMRMGKISGVLT